MKQPAIKIILSCISLLTWQFANAQETHLYPVETGGKFGYINEKGEEVIKPKFRAAKSFHEGLAAARLEGTYGYIDSTGEYVVPPVYDYAYPFHDGVAIVYKNAKSFYIDKKGKELFNCSGYQRLGNFHDDIALVQTTSKKQGVVDKTGKLIIDTAFGIIESWYTGLYVVSEPTYDDKGELKKRWTYAILDSNGDFIIPFGKYSAINSADGKYFVGRDSGVKVKFGDYQRVYNYDVFDTKGSILFTLDEHDGMDANNSSVQCGLLLVSIKNINDTGGNSQPRYGFVNLKGEIILDGSDYRFANGFYKNRAFIIDNKEQTWLINKKGERLNKTPFGQTKGDDFYNNVAYVMQGSKWGVIDTNGSFIFEPQFNNVTWTHIGDYFIFIKTPESTDLFEEGLGGVCNIDGTVVIDAVLQETYYLQGFHNGMMKCKIGGLSTYINRKGKIVWQQDSRKQDVKNVLNIDKMNANSYMAEVSRRSAKLSAKFSPGNNPKAGLKIIVDTDANDTTETGYTGCRGYIINNTNSSVSFRTSVGLLDMTMQAQDGDGKWKDIEYFDGSFCGNAYFDEQLNAWDYWTFVAPKYEGAVKTKMRMKLYYLDNNLRSNELEYYNNPLEVYSNEFDGSVNPAQFWRREHSLFGQNEYLPLDNENY